MFQPHKAEATFRSSKCRKYRPHFNWLDYLAFRKTSNCSLELVVHVEVDDDVCHPERLSGHLEPISTTVCYSDCSGKLDRFKISEKNLTSFVQQSSLRKYRPSKVVEEIQTSKLKPRMLKSSNEDTGFNGGIVSNKSKKTFFLKITNSSLSRFTTLEFCNSLLLLLLLLSFFYNTEQAFTEKHLIFGLAPISLIYASLAKKFKTHFSKQKPKKLEPKKLLLYFLSKTDFYYTH